MKRHIEKEASESAANDVRLPERGEVRGIERINIWMDLYQEHYQRIKKEAVDAGDKIMVFE